MQMLNDLLRKAVNLSIENIFKEIFSMRDIQTFVIERNRLRLQKGENTDGSKIKNTITGKDNYSYSTQQIYAKIGRRIMAGSNYTMKYSGDFYNSINIQNINENYFEIDADPIKSNGTNLFKTYGDFLIGASDEDFELLREKVLPLVNEKLRNQFF